MSQNAAIIIKQVKYLESLGPDVHPSIKRLLYQTGLSCTLIKEVEHRAVTLLTKGIVQMEKETGVTFCQTDGVDIVTLCSLGLNLDVDSDEVSVPAWYPSGIYLEDVGMETSADVKQHISQLCRYLLRCDLAIEDQRLITKAMQTIIDTRHGSALAPLLKLHDELKALTIGIVDGQGKSY